MGISGIVWLDHSENAQRYALNLLESMRFSQARDELGLGSVRDAIADVLSPGTSTIMTAARYFILIPNLYKEVERRQCASRQLVDQLVRKLEQGILKGLMQVAPARGSRVIGAQVYKSGGDTPQRIPSQIYWVGLRKLGIFRQNMGRRAFHHELGDPELPGEEDAERPPPWWHAGLPVADISIADERGLAMTPEESRFLKDRIRDVPGLLGLPTGADSLLAWLIDQPLSTILAMKSPAAAWIECATSSNPQLQAMSERARWLSDIIHGAQLLYNQLIAELIVNLPKRPPDLDWLDGSYFINEIQKWIVARSADQAWRSSKSVSWFWDWKVLSNASIPLHARSFIKEWVNLVGNDPTAALGDAARSLISNRERTLKRGRSRLTSADQLALFKGSAGAGALNFRWDITRQVAADIRVGLDSVHA